jgi:1-deoxy-D-xylulose-5-phosphate synthase
MDYPLLNTIFSPGDVKKLLPGTLQDLAKEIRQRIIEVMAVNGGHLASNLGVVELSIALHYVFNSPSDKMIWDVSHQTYPHKLLTGRNQLFPSIRQTNGLCGFSHPKESPHDHFYAGHAGTALSLGAGVAKARDLARGGEYILPIIGDATLTCGMSLEALNNISRDLKRFIVILNDNAMSISKNVGAITHILSRFLSNPTANKIYQELDTLVSKIPSYGTTLARQGHKITESIKNLVSPAAFFEHYGLAYIGPIDGHDISTLIHTLEGVKNSQWPVIIHVLTKKGQGMDIAIENPVSYHGAKPFNVDTGKFLPTTTSNPTFPNIFGKHILSMAESDPTIVAITPAMSAGSSLDAMMAKLPERCIDVGIAEGHAVTYAGGLAYGEKNKVVLAIYSTFLQRAFDNLFHDVCLQELPVVFAIDRAGISGPDGSTHHGIYDISFLNAMPNMVICQPRDGLLLRELLNSAFSWKAPVAIRYPNIATQDTPGASHTRELGKGEILEQGSSLAIIALGHMCQTALQVQKLLLQQGLKATIIDPIFVKPLDEELLHSVLASHKFLVTIEEHSVATGLGAIINNFLMKNHYLDINVLNLGIPEIFVGHGSTNKLLEELGLSPEGIVKSINDNFALDGQAFLHDFFKMHECVTASDDSVKNFMPAGVPVPVPECRH